MNLSYYSYLQHTLKHTVSSVEWSPVRLPGQGNSGSIPRSSVVVDKLLSSSTGSRILPSINGNRLTPYDIELITQIVKRGFTFYSSITYRNVHLCLPTLGIKGVTIQIDVKSYFINLQEKRKYFAHFEEEFVFKSLLVI